MDAAGVGWLPLLHRRRADRAGGPGALRLTLFAQLAGELEREGALHVLRDAAAERGWTVVEIDALDLPHLLWCAPFEAPALEAWWQDHVWYRRDWLSEVDALGSGRLRYPPAARETVRGLVYRLEASRREGLRLHTPDGRLLLDVGHRRIAVLQRLLADADVLHEPDVMREWLAREDLALVHRRFGHWFGMLTPRGLWLPMMSPDALVRWWVADLPDDGDTGYHYLVGGAGPPPADDALVLLARDVPLFRTPDDDNSGTVLLSPQGDRLVRGEKLR